MAVQLLKLGRFDQSFVVRMITDFFLVLVLVVIAELGVRFGLVLYDFHTAEKQDTQDAAQGREPPGSTAGHWSAAFLTP